MRLTGQATIAVASAALALAACRKDDGASEREGARESGIARLVSDTASGGVLPGIHPRVVYGVRTNPYDGDPTAATRGRQLFVQYNCYGCHGGRGGGGMGPNLRDSVWTYGGDDTHLFATIVEGRPAGMPAWGQKIPEGEIWQLVAYLHTLGTPREPDKPPPLRLGGAR